MEFPPLIEIPYGFPISFGRVFHFDGDPGLRKGAAAFSPTVAAAPGNFTTAGWGAAAAARARSHLATFPLRMMRCRWH